MIEYLMALFILAGVLLILVAAIGLVRLPDTYCRSHALAKAMPLGLNMILIAAWIYLGTGEVGFKSFLAILFQALSIPLSGHLIAKLAFEKELPRFKHKEIES